LFIFDAGDSSKLKQHSIFFEKKHDLLLTLTGKAFQTNVIPKYPIYEKNSFLFYTWIGMHPAALLPE